MNANRIPTTTAGITYGKKLTVRKKSAPRTPRISPRELPPTVTSTARAKASTITRAGQTPGGGKLAGGRRICVRAWGPVGAGRGQAWEHAPGPDVGPPANAAVLAAVPAADGVELGYGVGVLDHDGRQDDQQDQVVRE